VQVNLNDFPILFWTLVKEVKDLRLAANALGSWTHELKSCTTLGAGLCLNQFIFLLFIFHKLVSQ
jgi:hypothetical protein